MYCRPARIQVPTASLQRPAAGTDITSSLVQNNIVAVVYVPHDSGQQSEDTARGSPRLVPDRLAVANVVASASRVGRKIIHSIKTRRSNNTFKFHIHNFNIRFHIKFFFHNQNQKLELQISFFKFRPQACKSAVTFFLVTKLHGFIQTYY